MCRPFHTHSGRESCGIGKGCAKKSGEILWVEEQNTLILNNSEYPTTWSGLFWANQEGQNKKFSCKFWKHIQLKRRLINELMDLMIRVSVTHLLFDFQHKSNNNDTDLCPDKLNFLSHEKKNRLLFFFLRLFFWSEWIMMINVWCV